MTDAELQGIAAQALNMAKRDIQQRGGLGCLLATYYAREGLHRMKSVEETLVKILGVDWLNSGAKKDAAFSVLREAVSLCPNPPDAVVMVHAANIFKPTKALLNLSPEEQEAIQNAGHDRHHQAVEEGLISIQDALVAQAQSPKRVCWYVQAVDRGRFIDKPEVHFADLREFSGRAKMYYDAGEEDHFDFSRKRQ